MCLTAAYVGKKVATTFNGEPVPTPTAMDLARLVVAGAVAKAMEGLDLAYPKVEGQALKDLQSARKALEAEG